MLLKLISLAPDTFGTIRPVAMLLVTRWGGPPVGPVQLAGCVESVGLAQAALGGVGWPPLALHPALSLARPPPPGSSGGTCPRGGGAGPPVASAWSH